MIKGVGIDVVEVARIEEAMANPRFLRRILTSSEIREGLNAQSLAGRWAAKEAIAQAVGTHLGWQDVEIANDESGAPFTRILTGTFAGQIHLSISHERGVAAAVAIWEAE
jgi:holo-[acyl-carrier protein] synthase